MSKLVFERTGAALWAQVNVLGFSCMVLLWHVNMQRDKTQGSTSDRCLPPEQRSVRLSREKELVAKGGWFQAEHFPSHWVPLCSNPAAQHRQDMSSWISEVDRDVCANYHLIHNEAIEMGIIIDSHLTDKEIESWTYPRHKLMCKQTAQTIPGCTKKNVPAFGFTCCGFLTRSQPLSSGKATSS